MKMEQISLLELAGGAVATGAAQACLSAPLRGV